MSALRVFLNDVFGIHKPKLTLTTQKQGGADDVQQTPAVGMEANDAILKAQVKERLAAVTGPFKKTVADNGPDAQQLQMVFDMVQTSIGKQRFSEAQEGLDVLEDLLAEQANPAQAADSIGLDDSAEFDDAGAPDSGADDVEDIEQETQTSAGENSGRVGASASDVARDKGIETGIESGLKIIERLVDNFTLEATCIISNNTGHPLELDPSTLADGTGTFLKFPPTHIAAGEVDVEIIAENREALRVHYGKLEFKVKYFIGEQKTTAWTLYFRNTVLGRRLKKGKRRFQKAKRQLPPACDASVDGPDKDKFKSEATRVPGKKAGFYFTLNPIGGPTPDPEKPDPDKTDPSGPPKHEVKASCLITVTNNTQVELKLTSQTNERGDFKTQPALSIAPGKSGPFAYITTPLETEPEKQGCKGSVTYCAGSPLAAVWRCEWENLVGEKNTAHASLDPETAGFESVEQPGQGDEKVPFTFTISGGGTPKPPDPETPDKPDPVPPPPEDELLFNPPAEDLLPTLREGDQSVDGWVEYLQKLLNPYTDFALAMDGDFGPATVKALRAFQKKAGIQVDGVCGNQTWAALRKVSPPPSTDGREPHTFVDHGAKARWLTEKGNAYYVKDPDKLELHLVSVGDDTNLDGENVNVFVTVPGSERKGKVYPIVPDTDPPSGTYYVAIPDFLTTYPPNGAKVTEYIIEAYFDKALGGDFLSTHPKVK